MRGRDPRPDVPDAFVGGTTAWILEYIFGTPAHSNFIANQKNRFLEPHDAAALRSWEAGLSFAQNEAFTSLWNATEIRDAISRRRRPHTWRHREVTQPIRSTSPWSDLALGLRPKLGWVCSRRFHGPIGILVPPTTAAWPRATRF